MLWYSCGRDMRDMPGWIDGIKIPFQNLMGRIWTGDDGSCEKLMENG